MSCGHQHGDAGKKAGPPNVLKIFVIAVFAVGGVYYLWAQHRAHVFQYLPFAFFLLCPLLHLFGGHGAHGGHTDHKEGDKKEGGV